MEVTNISYTITPGWPLILIALALTLNLVSLAYLAYRRAKSS